MTFAGRIRPKPRRSVLASQVSTEPNPFRTSLAWPLVKEHAVDTATRNFILPSMRTSPGLLVGSALMAVLLVLSNATPSNGQTPKAAASASASKELSNESDDLVISGSGFTMATLQENAVAFSNRGYIWQKVPASLRGKRYTKINGGARPPLKVKAKKDTIVEVITETSEAPGVKMDGWIRTGIRFTFNNGKNAVMVLFKKKLTAGEEVDVPQECWAGTMVLLPP